jgi:hypothetical protein
MVVLALKEYDNPMDLAVVAGLIWDTKGGHGTVPAAVAAVRNMSRLPRQSTTSSRRDLAAPGKRRATHGPSRLAVEKSAASAGPALQGSAPSGGKSPPGPPGCSWPGKRPCWPMAELASSSPQRARFIFLKDENNRIFFSVDTGGASGIPPHPHLLSPLRLAASSRQQRHHSLLSPPPDLWWPGL